MTTSVGYRGFLGIAYTATVVHDYSMAKIDELAHRAARKARSAAELLDHVEAREEAWNGIVDVLYSSPEKPSEWSLVDAGARAIGERVRMDLRDQGRRQNKTAGGYEDAPRFEAYWIHMVGARPDWTDSIVNRMALPEVLAVLTPAQYEAIIALAAHGKLRPAAESLGMEYAAVKHRVHAGRKRMLEVWFEHETPHTTSKADAGVACRYGHARNEHGFKNAAGVWACHRCLRAAGRRRRARRGSLQLEAEPQPLAQADGPAAAAADGDTADLLAG